MEAEDRKYYIAADGGGTKTRVLLYDDRFCIISDETMPGTNTFLRSRETVSREMRELCDRLLPQYVTTIDMANIAVMKYGELFLDILREKCRVEAVNYFKESEMLMASSKNRYGIIVQSGTGSIVFLSQPDISRISGGWGFLLGDDGSGYDIGSRSLRAAVAYEEGLGPKTVMLDLIKEAWGVTRTRALIDSLFEDKDFVAKTASVAYITSKAAKENDSVAISIYEKAARDLSRRVLKLIEEAGGQWIGPVITAGGVWKGYSGMHKLFCKEIHARYRDAVIEFPEYEPVIGCILLGHNNIKTDFSDRYLYGADQNEFG